MIATIAHPAAAEFASGTEVPRRHARLLRSNPAANESLRASPRTIRLWFSEPVTLGLSRIKLVGARGAVVTSKATHGPGGDTTSLVATVGAPMPAGTYTVQWIVAADDGHPMRGTYTFTVTDGR